MNEQMLLLPPTLADEIGVLVCCECGAMHPELGEWFARKDGWEGFGPPLPVVQLDGSRRMERLGMCLSCRLTALTVRNPERAT